MAKKRKYYSPDQKVQILIGFLTSWKKMLLKIEGLLRKKQKKLITDHNI